MHYFNWKPAGYRKYTDHLTNEEDLCYRRLLDWQYENEAPIPLETESVARRLRLVKAVIDSVLKEFFEPTENGWWNAKARVQIEAYQGRKAINKMNGIKGGRPKKTKSVTDGKPNGNQTESKPKGNSVTHKLINSNSTPLPPEGESNSLFSHDSIQTDSQTGNSTEPSEKKKRAAGRSSGEVEFPDGLSEARRATLRTWLRYKGERRQHYKPTGFAALMKSLESISDNRLAAAVQMSMENSWSGLFPDKVDEQRDFGSQKKEDGAVSLKLSTLPEPRGWSGVWPEFSDDAQPLSWAEVPGALKSQITARLNA